MSLVEHARLCHEAYNGIKVGRHSFAVDEINNVVVIAIAGTKNLENFLEDASVWPSCSPRGYSAHAGVIDAFEEMEEAVLKFLPRVKQFRFAGHSLGGGIAQIFAEKYGRQVVTFGSLKTYFRFSKAPVLDHIRVVCDDDPVPLMPGILYTHRCDPVKLKDEDSSILDVSDHFLEYYIKMLEGGNYDQEYSNVTQWFYRRYIDGVNAAIG